MKIQTHSDNSSMPFIPLQLPSTMPILELELLGIALKPTCSAREVGERKFMRRSSRITESIILHSILQR
jgi:hypothetical protein